MSYANIDQFPNPKTIDNVGGNYPIRLYDKLKSFLMDPRVNFGYFNPGQKNSGPLLKRLPAFSSHKYFCCSEIVDLISIHCILYGNFKIDKYGFWCKSTPVMDEY